MLGGVARCHGAFGIEDGRQLGQFLDGAVVPHGLVGHEGHFVPLDLDLDRNNLRFEEALIDRRTGAPMALDRQRVLVLP